MVPCLHVVPHDVRVCLCFRELLNDGHEEIVGAPADQDRIVAPVCGVCGVGVCVCVEWVVCRNTVIIGNL